VALIRWAYENKLNDVRVVFIDTGWGAESWDHRTLQGEEYVRSLGFEAVRIKPTMQFEELMKFKKGFPSQRYQWCSVFLKGIPFLDYAEKVDPEGTAVVMVGKRRAESVGRRGTPEFIEKSEYHGGRKLWHPLYLHSDEDRDLLISKTPLPIVAHRSLECSPCINANKADLRALTEVDVLKVENLEKEIGKTVFRPKKKMGAVGIRQVIEWARSSKGTYKPEKPSGCDGGLCGL
jgi:3'-phosphoadenosine 5'-phosphosulfate sulfotransferase (PAPS reductase)/FAD synthetase